MERDWKRLGRAFATARQEAGLTQEEVAGRLHVSRTPIQAIERGRQSNGKDFLKITGTMRAYARLLRWTDNSIERVLDGDEPEQLPPPPVDPPTTPVEPDPDSDITPAIDLELRTGRTLESNVLHIGPEEADGRVIVVVKGGEDITEEQVEELLRDWRKRRRHLQGVATDPETSADS